MRGTFKDIPVTYQMPEGTFRETQWGGMNIQIGDITARMDPGPLFKGLPGDRCQCPHWGYVLKGTLRYHFADREEVYKAGDVYYAAPGHLPVLEAGTEFVEFSPADEEAKTKAVLERNMANMAAKAS
ncbi:MAG: cupin domain-containing protein [bacterium]